MPTTGSDADRIARALDRACITPYEFAERARISAASAYDLKAFDDELQSVYSPNDLKRFATILRVSPTELLGITPPTDPISSEGLADAVREFCRERSITVEDFEALSGWRVAATLADPRRFLDEYSIEGIRDVCGAVALSWERVISGL